MTGRQACVRAGVAGLTAIILTSFFPPAARAGITGSAHDFSGLNFVDRGSCSACHIPHLALDTQALWSRDLTDERTTFDQASNPNYVQGATIPCYDCHDNQDAIDVDEDPPPIDWGTSIHGGPGYPLDIAFDDYPGSQGSSTDVGYYELIDGTLPSGGAGGGPTDGSPTGGHFWQSVPSNTGVPAYDQGDKLDCNICHDPHSAVTGSNDVMFRLSTSDGMGGTIDLGDNRTASTNTRARAGQSAQTYNGRNMCAACHTYSDTGATGPGIPLSPVDMWNVTVPKPPTNIAAHAYDPNSSTACTECHRHNKIVFSCEECHGFPPVNGSAFDPVTNPGGYSYDPQVALTHQRHLDALGTDFDCEMCHGPDAGSATWHNQGGGTVAQADVDIMGEQAWWDPDASRTTGYTGTASGEPIPAGYEFTAKGGGDLRCSGLACHGEPPNSAGALNWTDDMVDEGSGNFLGDGRDVCTWCHDSTPSLINGAYAPSVMGNGTTFGFDVNGHGLPTASNYDQTAIGDAAGPPGAGLDCDFCHDATYAGGVPTRTHFGVGTDNRDEMRLRSSIDGYAIDDGDLNGDLAPDDACNACHNNSSPGPNAGPMISHHGNDYATPLEGPFVRNCRQCHELHGSNWNGSGRNLHMIGKWLDTANFGTPDAGEGAYVDSNAADEVADITTADNAVVFTSFTGADSFDEIDNVTPPDTAADNADDICGTCHTHPGTGGGDHNGTASFSGDLRGTDCMQCHDHDYDDLFTTADAFAPSGCEGCHNLNGYDPGGGLPVAPNVMGDGTNPLGNPAHTTPKPYDDGTYGFNVNGHGRDADTFPPPGGIGPVINVACTDCHNIGDPPGTHNDGNLNQVNSNTFHLISGFIDSSPSSESAAQLTFDNFCYNQCHAGQTVDYRHPKATDTPPDPLYSMEFGTHNSYATGPMSTPPWTIDRDITQLGAFDGQPYYGLCISCHNPHGTNVAAHPEDSLNNFMFHMTKSAMCSFCHQ